MSLDVSALFAEAKSLGMYEDAKPRKRAITKRRYNVIVDGDIVAQYCTLNDVKVLRNQYREQGKPITIDEVAAFDSNGNDVANLPAPHLPEAGQYAVAQIKGIQNFETPTMTAAKLEAFSKRHHKETAIKQDANLHVIENPWRGKNSSLHEEYMKGVIRDGFVVLHKNSGQMIYWGQRKEVIAYLNNFSGDISTIQCKPFTKRMRKEYGL